MNSSPSTHIRNQEPQESRGGPLVSVVVLNWNGINFLKEFMPGWVSTASQASESGKLKVDVWLADNASTDQSVSWTREHHPEVKVLAMDENRGFAGGYNHALDQIPGDYFVLLNQDVETTPGHDWISPLIDTFESDTALGAAQPKILAQREKESFEYAGAAGGYLDSLGYPFCRGRIFDSLEKDERQYDSVEEIFWATGACLFIRASLYKGLGGLHPEFFAHMEEIDLCWRVKRCGYRIECHPSARVYHVGGGSLDRGSPRKTYLNFRNNMRMLVMNLSGAELIWKLPLRWLLDLVAALKDLLGGRTSMASAAFRGSSAIIPTLGHWLSERKQSRQVVEANRIKADRSRQKGWYSGVLIVDYFLKGKKKWSDL